MQMKASLRVEFEKPMPNAFSKIILIPVNFKKQF